MLKYKRFCYTIKRHWLDLLNVGRASEINDVMFTSEEFVRILMRSRVRAHDVNSD